VSEQISLYKFRVKLIEHDVPQFNYGDTVDLSHDLPVRFAPRGLPVCLLREVKVGASFQYYSPQLGRWLTCVQLTAPKKFVYRFEVTREFNRPLNNEEESKILAGTTYPSWPSSLHGEQIGLVGATVTRIE
jgi:hypothetical protein